MDILEQLSASLADRLAQAASLVVGVVAGQRTSSGILWGANVVIASEQCLRDATDFSVTQGDARVGATLLGRDPGTNVAVLKLETAREEAVPPAADAPRVGSLALVVGAAADGGPTGRLAMVQEVGASWHSMAGGRIDALIRLDTRLGADEGGPVLAMDGGLLGMSTSGPRRRTILIPTSTLARITAVLLADGRVARPWLGIGLQPVLISENFRQSTGRESGLMVVSLAPSAPAEVAGVLPGDIVLDIDGTPVNRPRALNAALSADHIGQTVVLRVLRAGAVQVVNVTVAARPAG